MRLRLSACSSCHKRINKHTCQIVEHLDVCDCITDLRSSKATRCSLPSNVSSSGQPDAQCDLKCMQMDLSCTIAWYATGSARLVMFQSLACACSKVWWPGDEVSSISRCGSWHFNDCPRCDLVTPAMFGTHVHSVDMWACHLCCIKRSKLRRSGSRGAPCDSTWCFFSVRISTKNRRHWGHMN